MDNIICGYPAQAEELCPSAGPWTPVDIVAGYTNEGYFPVGIAMAGTTIYVLLRNPGRTSGGTDYIRLVRSFNYGATWEQQYSSSVDSAYATLVSNGETVLWWQRQSSLTGSVYNLIAYQGEGAVSPVTRPVVTGDRNGFSDRVAPNIAVFNKTFVAVTSKTAAAPQQMNVMRSVDGVNWVSEILPTTAAPLPFVEMKGCASDDMCVAAAGYGVTQAATTISIVRSFDGGYNWSAAPQPGAPATIRANIKGFYGARGRMYMLGTPGNPSYVSTDQCETWQEMPASFPGTVAVTYSDNVMGVGNGVQWIGNKYCYAGPDGIYYSLDGINDWYKPVNPVVGTLEPTLMIWDGGVTNFAVKGYTVSSGSWCDDNLTRQRVPFRFTGYIGGSSEVSRQPSWSPEAPESPGAGNTFPGFAIHAASAGGTYRMTIYSSAGTTNLGPFNITAPGWIIISSSWDTTGVTYNVYADDAADIDQITAVNQQPNFSGTPAETIDPSDAQAVMWISQCQGETIKKLDGLLQTAINLQYFKCNFDYTQLPNLESIAHFMDGAAYYNDTFPVGWMGGHTRLTDYRFAYANMTAIRALPESHWEDAATAVMADAVYQNCTSARGTVMQWINKRDDWDAAASSSPGSHQGGFANCAALTDYSTIPDEWKTPVTE